MTNLLKDESGATLLEYGLLTALIAMAIVVSITTVGEAIRSTFSSISAKLIPL